MMFFPCPLLFFLLFRISQLLHAKMLSFLFIEFIFMIYYISLFYAKYYFIAHFNPQFTFTAHFAPTLSSFLCCCEYPTYLGFSSKLYPKCLFNRTPALTCGSSLVTHANYVYFLVCRDPQWCLIFLNTCP